MGNTTKFYFISALHQTETVIITASPITTIRRGNLLKASRLEKSPFNVVNPPNKTVIDAMHGTFSDMNQVNFLV
jgi:hypothetical protein